MPAGRHLRRCWAMLRTSTRPWAFITRSGFSSCPARSSSLVAEHWSAPFWLRSLQSQDQTALRHIIRPYHRFFIPCWYGFGGMSQGCLILWLYAARSEKKSSGPLHIAHAFVAAPWVMCIHVMFVLCVPADLHSTHVSHADRAWAQFCRSDASYECIYMANCQT